MLCKLVSEPLNRSTKAEGGLNEKQGRITDCVNGADDNTKSRHDTLPCTQRAQPAPHQVGVGDAHVHLRKHILRRELRQLRHVLPRVTTEAGKGERKDSAASNNIERRSSSTSVLCSFPYYYKAKHHPSHSSLFAARTTPYTLDMRG